MVKEASTSHRVGTWDCCRGQARGLWWHGRVRRGGGQPIPWVTLGERRSTETTTTDSNAAEGERHMTEAGPTNVAWRISGTSQAPNVGAGSTGAPDRWCLDPRTSRARYDGSERSSCRREVMPSLRNTLRRW
jgi:hypothetical protein